MRHVKRHREIDKNLLYAHPAHCSRVPGGEELAGGHVCSETTHRDTEGMITTPDLSGTTTSRRRRRRRRSLLALFLALPTKGHCLLSVCDTRSFARGATTRGRASSNHEARLLLQSQRQESAEGGSVPGLLRDVVIEKIEELGGGKVQQVRGVGFIR